MDGSVSLGIPYSFFQFRVSSEAHRTVGSIADKCLLWRHDRDRRIAQSRLVLVKNEFSRRPHTKQACNHGARPLRNQNTDLLSYARRQCEVVRVMKGDIFALRNGQ